MRSMANIASVYGWPRERDERRKGYDWLNWSRTKTDESIA